MAASVDNESEILLGNKQLLMVFAVVAVLLATAFAGGYMLGKSSTDKKPAAATDSAHTGEPAETNGGPITQKLTPDDSVSSRSEPVSGSDPAGTPKDEDKPMILGCKPKSLVKTAIENVPGSPLPGQAFVQVVALSRKDAEGTAEVLRKHQFPARIAPAPGSPGIFRVLVGPAKDAADLRNTADALRKIGYTKCFTQHY